MGGTGQYETGLHSRGFVGRSADATRMRVASRVKWRNWKGKVGCEYIGVRRRYKDIRKKGHVPVQCVTSVFGK
jgi:hypothetical protein